MAVLHSGLIFGHPVYVYLSCKLFRVVCKRR